MTPHVQTVTRFSCALTRGEPTGAKTASSVFSEARITARLRRSFWALGEKEVSDDAGDSVFAGSSDCGSVCRPAVRRGPQISIASTLLARIQEPQNNAGATDPVGGIPSVVQNARILFRFSLSRVP